MRHQVFISYPLANQDIVENLASRLREFGVTAWVYSLDRTLAEDLWNEIEEKINRSDVFLLGASRFSLDAKGQHREVALALARLRDAKSGLRAVPLILDNIGFHTLPEELRFTNGLRVDALTVKSTAFEIAQTFFPDLIGREREQEWRSPKPGQWLEVSRISPFIEEYFELGDRVYFRRLSPLGLFECYSPKRGQLFWFAPQDLRMADVVDEDGSLERTEVPWRYRYSTSIDWERLGLQQMEKEGRLR